MNETLDGAVARRRQRSLVAVCLGTVLTLLAIGLLSLGRPAAPSVTDGYVVLLGETEGGAPGWLAGMVDDPTDLAIHDAYTVAGIHWRDLHNSWHHWNSPEDPTPDCLIANRPVRAALGYVDVAPVDGAPGFRQAVWLKCLADRPAS